MKLIRIDTISRGGHPLELHPSLTVLLGASPEQLRRLAEIVATLGGSGRVPSDTATIDLHGVQMPLDAAAATLLRTEQALSPVLSHSASPVPPAPPAGDEAGATGDQAHFGESGEAALADLWRQVALLEQQLDPGAQSEAAESRQQAEELDQRLAARRAERDRQRSVSSERRGALIAAAHDVQQEVARLCGMDPQMLMASRDELSRILSGPGGPDPEASNLADELESVGAQMQLLADQRAAAQRLLTAAESQLVASRAAYERAEQDHRNPRHDPDLTRELETVRDRLFAASQSAALEDELDELRSEEAELLDRLGYESYSDFLYGVPNSRAIAEQDRRLGVAQSQLEAAHSTVDSCRSELLALEEPTALESRKSELMHKAEGLVALRRSAAVGGSSSALMLDATAGDSLGRNEMLVAELREVRRPTPSADDPQVITAAQSLRNQLVLTGAEVGWARSPSEFIAVADVWLERLADVPAQLAAARQRAAELDEELTQLEAELIRSDGGEVDDLSKELQLTRGRLASAEDRAIRHQVAVEELSRCHASIAALQQIDASAESSVDSVQPWRSFEWSLTCGIGARRATSIGGSVPLIVDHLPTDRVALARSLERIAALAPLVQVIVVTSDPAAAVWAEQAGPVVARAIRC